MNWWAIGAVVIATVGVLFAIWRIQYPPKKEEDDRWLGW